jgi:serine/threonine protein kinase/Tfp pilus assembly protein PilF
MMSLAIGTRLGPYEILSTLGAGGMGEVYRAKDLRLDREVALKVLPEQFAQDAQALARFQREARAIAALPHPHILTLFDVGMDQGRTYAVMELLEGQTLGTCLKQASLDWRRAVEIAAAVAEGLAAAHTKGVVHRDVKPDNIFLTTRGEVKILDFGLARLENKGATPPQEATATFLLETQPGMLLGTVTYMSPEQIRGQPADARSDVFAFGCTLYEMVTGRRPFFRDTNADTMAAILHEPPPALSESGRQRPAELERLILRCLEKVPERRFQSARELATALKTILQSTGPEGTGTGKKAPASIAVLPFVNMSSDKENEYFSDGLAEELINALNKIEGLRVASRTSAFSFKGKNEDVRKIGEQLNVQTVLEGSVRKSGNRLRISAQLVKVADGYQLWSETYNRQLEDVFAIQDEISQSITTALRVVLTEKDKHALERGQPADIHAYDFYLRGRQFFHQFRRKSLEYARQMFQRALEIDANYARAHAGVADCCSFLYMYWDASQANLEQADAASQKALELGPELAEAHVARGLAVSRRKQYHEACMEFETALRLDPKLYEACYFYARVCFAQGHLRDTARLYEQACQIRPEDYQVPLLLNGVYRGLGQNAEAEAARLRGLRLAEKHLRLNPDDARALYLGAGAWLQTGDHERSLDWANRALAIDPDEPLTLYNVACNYSLLGQAEEAIDCLERAVQHGYRHKQWLEHDSDLDALREHPRFQALLQKL